MLPNRIASSHKSVHCELPPPRIGLTLPLHLPAHFGAAELQRRVQESLRGSIFFLSLVITAHAVLDVIIYDET